MICPLCENNKGAIVYNKIPNLTRCSSCGFVYILGQYSKELYSQDYFMKEGDVTGRDYFSEWSKLYDVARFSQEIKRIKKFKQGGKVLDIGCATGSFMKMVHLEGFEPYGVDVSSFAVDYIKNTYGFPAFVGFLAESNFDKGMFDIVTMHHVIEHIPNPVKFLLNEVKPILKDNGLLVAEVPNFGSFESKINREEWEDLKPWEHLNQFTPETLRLCLEKAGFRVIKTATYSPQTHRLLWRYPQLLSFIGLPESVIKQIAHLIRLYLKDKDSKDKAEGSSEGLRDRTLLDDITRFLVMPLDFLYSNLRIGKYLAIYAEPV